MEPAYIVIAYFADPKLTTNYAARSREDAIPVVNELMRDGATKIEVVKTCRVTRWIAERCKE
jgi:hypothetical protein